ncbi:hypothetical protein DUNSADRAFT_16205 [Dunaliella salina]|uniref:SAP domain-containing protein n=1 Tax=Dunaliella salina TaxID=3046 RepID=A0ABQ7G447_DUNSA|nr:hypothetical protein DUNSADRAFT_16205 [Dunaliella salina]|eukprot:KAF5829345.1 hypothetical protein DUNSADRAFT_16205 [Dunaliella salina]
MAASSSVQDTSGALLPPVAASAASAATATAESVSAENAQLARAYAAWPWHLVRGHEDGFGSSTSGTATAHLSSPLESDEHNEMKETEQLDRQRRGLEGPVRGKGGRQQQRKPGERVQKAQAPPDLSARAADPGRLRALEGMTVKALKEALKARHLAVSGTKPELINCLLGEGNGGAGGQKRRAEEGKVPQHTKPGKRPAGAGHGPDTPATGTATAPTPSSSRPMEMARAAGAQEEGVEEEDLTLPAGSGSEVEGHGHGQGEVLYEGSSDLEDEEVRGRGAGMGGGRPEETAAAQHNWHGERLGDDAGVGAEGGRVRSTKQREGRLIPSSMVISPQASAVAAPSALAPPAAGAAKEVGEEGGPSQPAGSRMGQRYVPLGVQRPKRFGLQRLPREQGVQRAERGWSTGGDLSLAEGVGGRGGGEEGSGFRDGKGEVDGAAAASHFHHAVQARGGIAKSLQEGSKQEIDLTLSTDEEDGEQEEHEQARKRKKSRSKGGSRAVGGGLRQSEQQEAQARAEPLGPVRAITQGTPSLRAPQAHPQAPPHLHTQHAPTNVPPEAAAAAAAEPPPPPSSSQVGFQSQAGGASGRPIKSLRDIVGLPFKPKKEPQSQATQEPVTQQQQQLLKHEPQSQQQEQVSVGLQSQQQSAPEVPWDEMLGFNTQMLAQPLPLNTQTELLSSKPHPSISIPPALVAPAINPPHPHAKRHPFPADAAVPAGEAPAAADARAPAVEAATTSAAPPPDPACPAAPRLEAKANAGAAPPAASKGAVQGGAARLGSSSAQPSSSAAGAGTQLQQRKRPRCLADLADMSSSDDDGENGGGSEVVLAGGVKGPATGVADPHTVCTAPAAIPAGRATEALGPGPSPAPPPAPAPPSGSAPAAALGSRSAASKLGSGRHGLASLLMGDSDSD